MLISVTFLAVEFTISIQHSLEPIPMFHGLFPCDLMP
jgi:hypothetical protein